MQDPTSTNGNISDLLATLDNAEKQAILFCERDGNGKYIYVIHRLVKKQLMSLTPVPKLQMISAYRLNALGLLVRDHLERLSI